MICRLLAKGSSGWNSEFIDLHFWRSLWNYALFQLEFRNTSLPSLTFIRKLVETEQLRTSNSKKSYIFPSSVNFLTNGAAAEARWGPASGEEIEVCLKYPRINNSSLKCDVLTPLLLCKIQNIQNNCVHWNSFEPRSISLFLGINHNSTVIFHICCVDLFEVWP